MLISTWNSYFTSYIKPQQSNYHSLFATWIIDWSSKHKRILKSTFEDVYETIPCALVCIVVPIQYQLVKCYEREPF